MKILQSRSSLRKPLRIGITGGIGSGKSTICQIFSILGIPTYDADTAAKKLMQENETLKNEIVKTFGKDSYDTHGHLNTGYLSQIVFKDESKREVLNKLVHPHTIKDFECWTEKQSNVPYIVKEAALLFEAGADKSVDQVIVVYAPEELRITRVLKRDPTRTASSIRTIMTKQLSEEEKMKKADFIIWNNESKPVILQVIQLHQLLIKQSSTC